ncbi:MAG: pirin family protein, partial [Acidobacteriota bacterium]|nr:pirin family protein [Acidobacteriota bacterium]
SKLDSGQQVTHALREKRKAWLQVARGAAAVNGVDLKQGDGAAIEDEKRIEITGSEPVEVLLFDMA